MTTNNAKNEHRPVTACPYTRDRARWHCDVHYTDPRSGKAERVRRVAPAGLTLEGALAWGEGERLRIVTGLALGSVAVADKEEIEPKKSKKIPTLADVWPAFLETYVARLKYSTRKSYGPAGRYILATLGDLRLDTIGEVELERCKEHMIASVGQSTAKMYLSKALKCLRWSMSKGHVPRGILPTVEWAKEDKGELEVYSAEELERMVAAAGDAYHRVLALLLADACLRIGECAGLKWTDIRAGHLSIVRNVCEGRLQDSPKGERGEVPLTPRLELALGELQATGECDTWILPRRSKGRRRLVAHDHSDEGTLGEWVSKLQAAAGLTAHGAHRVRHSRLTILAERGVPLRALQHLARHASEKTTERYYLHVRRRTLAAMAVAEIASMTAPGNSPVTFPLETGNSLIH